MHIREKAGRDADACLALILQVHGADGYPRYLPDDVPGFLTPPYESASWVAEDDGRVVGHVALHDASVDPTLLAAQRATGLPAERLAVLSRLLVAPTVRRTGVGRDLLRTATRHAWSLGRRTVLDVVQDSAAPIALYESEGWARTESLRLVLSDAKALDLWIYVGPDRPAT